MKTLDLFHSCHVRSRRAHILRDHLAELIRPNECLLDVGTGDGLLAALIREKRSDVSVSAIDVAMRGDAHIPIQLFDGQRIPYDDGAFDVVMFVDVLHHTDVAMVLLREAVRVSRHAVLLKDHTLNGFCGGLTLRFMDRVGNQRHDVPLPYNYWSREQWLEACRLLGLNITAWKSDLCLYPWPANWIFERSLHFIARLDHLSQAAASV